MKVYYDISLLSSKPYNQHHIMAIQTFCIAVIATMQSIHFRSVKEAADALAPSGARASAVALIDLIC